MSTGQGLLGNNMFAYCLNNPIRYADDSGHAVYDCFDESDDKNNPFDDIDSMGGGNRSLGVSSYYASGAAKYSNGGNGTGSMVGDMAYQQTKAANTTCVPQYSWGDLLNLLTGNSSSQCFVAGTLIQTAESTKPIEDIQVGDFVWAWDEETSDVALKKVVETYINTTEELVHIFVNGEEIITTPTHPFYSPVKGWTDAIRLRAGDILVLVNGEYVVVEKVQHEILESPITVYNFQVEDYHTYYVSTVAVLVHNSCNHNSQWDAERSNHWRKQGNNYSTPTNELSASGTYNVTEQNINLMKNGYAPYGTDGFKVQLHHPNGIANDFFNYYGQPLKTHTGKQKLRWIRILFHFFFVYYRKTGPKGAVIP